MSAICALVWIHPTLMLISRIVCPGDFGLDNLHLQITHHLASFKQQHHVGDMTSNKKGSQRFVLGLSVTNTEAKGPSSFCVYDLRTVSTKHSNLDQ